LIHRVGVSTENNKWRVSLFLCLQGWEKRTPSRLGLKMFWYLLSQPRLRENGGGSQATTVDTLSPTPAPNFSHNYSGDANRHSGLDMSRDF
jgi:hypothetical protein